MYSQCKQCAARCMLPSTWCNSWYISKLFLLISPVSKLCHYVHFPPNRMPITLALHLLSWVTNIQERFVTKCCDFRISFLTSFPVQNVIWTVVILRTYEFTVTKQWTICSRPIAPHIWWITKVTGIHVIFAWDCQWFLSLAIPHSTAK